VVNKETELLLGQAREALKRVEAEREAMSAAYREREREERAEFQAEARRLKRVIAELSKPPVSSAKAAGPKAMKKIEDALAAGSLAQAEIVRRTGLNDGTVSHGLRALMEEGRVEPTGTREKGSRVFRQRKQRGRRVA
jgi:DNA-binding transcriptional ArsR family regulator